MKTNFKSLNLSCESNAFQGIKSMAEKKSNLES